MSFLDTLGGVAQGIGDFTGLTDAWHDISNGFAGADASAVTRLGGFLSAATEPARHLWSNTFGLAIQADATANHYIQSGQGYVSGLSHYNPQDYANTRHGDTTFGGSAAGGRVAGATAGVLGVNHQIQNWANPGETPDQYKARLFDQTIGGGWDKGLSLGEVTALGSIDLKSAGTALNMPLPTSPLDLTSTQRDALFRDPGAPYKWASGPIDTLSGSLEDPANLLPGVGKAARAAVAGKYITEIHPSWLKGGFQIGQDNALKMLDEGLMDPESRIGGHMAGLAKADEVTILSSPEARRSGNSAAFAHLMGNAKTVQEVRDTYQILMRLGSDADLAAARDRLVSAHEARGGNAVAQQYLVDTALNGRMEHDVADGVHFVDERVVNSHQALLEEQLSNPQSSFSRAYQQALQDRVDLRTPTVTQMPGTAPWVSFNTSMAERRAASRYGAGIAQVVTDQPTSLHPIFAVVNHGAAQVGQFFTRERTSGWINYHHSDSVNEVGALISDIDAAMGGHMKNTGEGRAWINQYINARSIPDQQRVVQALESRGFDLISEKHGHVDAEGIYNAYSASRQKALDTYRDQGFISFMTDDGVPTVAKFPILERTTANQTPLANFREVDKVLRQTNPGVMRAVLQDAGRLAVGGMDVVNDIFKMSVLFRIGYPIRNLTEAFASMFVTGYLGHAMLSAGKGAGAVWADGMRARSNRIIDTLGVWRGTRDDIHVANNDLALAEAKVRSHQNLLDGLREGLAASNTNLTSDEVDLLRQYRDGSLTSSTAISRAQDVLRRVRSVAELRGETTRAVTYHATSDPNWSSINGDWLDTTPSQGVASAMADRNVHQYLSWETASDPTQSLPSDFAPRPGSGTRRPRLSPEDRADRKSRYDALLDEVRQHLADDKVVEYTRGNSWGNLTESVLENMRSNRPTIRRVDLGDGRYTYITGPPRTIRDQARLVFRVRDPHTTAGVVPIHSYGDTLDLTRYANLPQDLRDRLPDEVRRRIGAGGQAGWREAWRDPEVADILHQYAREAGIGRMIFPDSQWGPTTRVFKDTVVGRGGRGSQPVIERNIDNLIREAQEDPSLRIIADPIRRSARENRQARNALRGTSPTGSRAYVQGRAVHYGYNDDYLQSLIDRGAPDAIKQAVSDMAEAKANAEAARTQVALIQQRMSRGVPTKRMGTHSITIQTDHGPHTVHGAFGGSAGDLMARATHGDPNYDHLVGNGAGTLNAIPSSVAVKVRPDDPRYFEAWANMLNWHWRDPATGQVDPLIERLLQGQHPEEVIRYLKGTPEGRRYADDLGWRDSGPNSIEDAVYTAHRAIPLYLPDDTLKAVWRNGQADAEHLSARYGGRTDLPELNGLLIPQSREYADMNRAKRMFQGAVRKSFHAIGALPETTFARHPLYRSYYNTEMQRLVPQAARQKGEHLTLDEINKISAEVQERGRKVVNDTLFTINRRTGASRNLRLVAPFYAAWENTLKRWGNFAVKNSEGIVKGGAYINRALHSVNLVNTQTGQKASINDTPYENLSLVLPWKPKDLSGDEWGANIPITSMDVLFQGQPMNPGIGPWVALPMIKVMDKQPRAGQILDWAFPAGRPQDATDLFIPATLKRIKSMVWHDQSWVNDANRIMQQEVINYQQGKRADLPLWGEIEDKTQKFYALKMLTNFAAPASVSYKNDVNYYQNTYRQYKTLYGNDADAKFLAEHPEAFVVLESLSDNRTGVRSTLSTVDNLKKYTDLAAAGSAADPEMVGWLGNYGQGAYNPNDFNSDAYDWELNNAPVTGGENFRTQKNPMEIYQAASVHAGWVQYRQYMDMVTSQITNQGIDPKSLQGQKVMQNVRRTLAGVIGAQNQDWYNAYVSSDKSKYDKRANFMESVVTDPTFMADHMQDGTIQSIATFLQIRNQMAADLRDLAHQGGSKRIGAKSNADIAALYNARIEALKEQNLGFADFYDRYFTNDPVTL